MRISDWSSDVCSSDLLRLDVGEDEPRVLEIDHILAESLAVPCEGDRLVEGALRRRLRGDRDRKPLLRQIAHEIHEPAILSPKEVDRGRSEERRVGKECVSTCRSRWETYH